MNAIMEVNSPRPRNMEECSVDFKIFKRLIDTSKEEEEFIFIAFNVTVNYFMEFH